MSKSHPAIGDRVIVIEGSSDGVTGVIILIKGNQTIRIKRDHDGEEVDISRLCYEVLKEGKL